MFDTFHYGVCYYPEHWDEKRLASDFSRMKQCGFDIVRMGEGAWGYFEPSEGRYRFDLFDRAIDLCRENGIRVILGTPTYCAPAWVSSNYPEVLRWNFERIPMRHGSRRNLNYTSPKYLDLSDKICAALAAHYKDNPQVIGWQLDNEFNCHMDVSYAPTDTVAFGAWVRKKYQTLDALNEAWGTRFWSQQYDAWDQVDLPHPTPTWKNPSQLLDETRFISDCVVKFAARQAAILRQHNKKWQITHNGLFDNIDGVALTAALDFFSHDNYPLFSSHWTGPAFALATSRSLAFPFAIMEQQSGPGGQMGYLLPTPRPGQMSLWAWQSIAHGAKTLLYFRWRTCPYGAEQHWHGLLDQDDRDNRRITEAKFTGEQFRKLPSAFHDAPPAKAIAVLRDFDNDANDRRINTYTRVGEGETYRWVAECAKRHMPVDIAWATSDLTGYKLLIAPHLKLVDARLAKKLTTFVKSGGTLVLGAQSGLKDRNCHIVEIPLPGLFRELAGITVDDWTTLPEKSDTRLAQMSGGRLTEFNTFVEKLTCNTAEPLAYWTGSDAILGTSPAITRNSIGKGTVIYFGAYAPESAIAALLDLLAPIAGIQPLAGAGPDVEMIERNDGKRRYLVLMNHSDKPQRVTGFPKGKNLLSGVSISEALVLSGYGVAVIECR